tara:strand:+ start:111 stop:569 length:459 start_codon:yes stop_codon:yes gene_type:complete
MVKSLPIGTKPPQGGGRSDVPIVPKGGGRRQPIKVTQASSIPSYATILEALAILNTLPYKNDTDVEGAKAAVQRASETSEGKALIARAREELGLGSQTRVKKGGVVRKKGQIKNPREFVRGGMYRGKPHAYAAGGRVMDNSKRNRRNRARKS